MNKGEVNVEKPGLKQSHKNVTFLQTGSAIPVMKRTYLCSDTRSVQTPSQSIFVYLLKTQIVITVTVDAVTLTPAIDFWADMFFFHQH